MKTSTAVGIATALIAGVGAWYWLEKGVVVTAPSLPVVQNFEGEADASKGGYCTESQRNAEICTADYTPVCATVNIQCIKAPCNPVQQTFSNSCNACKNSLVNSYLVGACK